MSSSPGSGLKAIRLARRSLNSSCGCTEFMKKYLVFEGVVNVCVRIVVSVVHEGGEVSELFFQDGWVGLGIGECGGWGSGFLDVHVVHFLVLLFKVPGDEGLTSSDLSALAFFAYCVSSHRAAFVVSSVLFCAVRATEWMVTKSAASLTFLLVKVS